MNEITVITEKEQLIKYREWQKQNSEWELCCDIPDTDTLYTQWRELLKQEQMPWIRSYRDSAKAAFEELAVKKCKVPQAVLCPDMQLRDLMDWPHGFCMMVFRTGEPT